MKHKLDGLRLRVGQITRHSPTHGRRPDVEGGKPMNGSWSLGKTRKSEQIQLTFYAIGSTGRLGELVFYPIVSVTVKIFSPSGTKTDSVSLIEW